MALRPVWSLPGRCGRQLRRRGACTDDACNEATNSCDNIANNGNCDDGLFCNGAEACDAALGCLAGADPCLPGDVCLEDSDTCCVPVAEICSDAVDNDCDGFTDCNDSDCTLDLACAAPVCGDAFCDPGEDQCNCPQDCGAPPATELNCADGVDEDCDGLTDCDDADCSADPVCAACKPEGKPCTTNAECCDGRCRDRKGALICD